MTFNMQNIIIPETLEKQFINTIVYVFIDWGFFFFSILMQCNNGDAYLGKPHNKAMHLHAIATLKVIIGTTHTDDPNTIQVDKDNNTIQANGKDPVANGKAIDQNNTGNSDGDKVVLTVDGTAKQSTDTASGSGDNSHEVEVSDQICRLMWMK